MTYAARLTKEEGLIDWTLSAQRIHDRVRGLYPWPPVALPPLSPWNDATDTFVVGGRGRMVASPG